ncbi:MAG: hypothetical protein WC485_04845 [Opitutaceae bacterium]
MTITCRSCGCGIIADRAAETVCCPSCSACWAVAGGVVTGVDVAASRGAATVRVLLAAAAKQS